MEPPSTEVSSENVSKAAGSYSECLSIEVEHDNLRSMLNKDRLEHNHCDVTLVADGRHFPAHKIILAATSSYFSSMFNSNFLEKNSNKITINAVHSDALETVLNFIYLTDFEMSTENMTEVTACMDHFLLKDGMVLCKKFCVKVMEDMNLVIHHVFTLRKMSYLYSWKDLQHNIEDLISKKFEQIVDVADFKSISLGEIVDFLATEPLYNVSESVVFKAACQWLDTAADRDQYVPLVMKQVRFPLLDGLHVLEASKSDRFMNSKSVRDQIDLAVNLHLLARSKEGYSASSQHINTNNTAGLACKPRYGQTDSVLFLLQHSGTFHCYSSAEQIWHRVAQRPNCMNGCNQYAVDIHPYVYIYQIRRHTLELVLLQKYHTEQNIWLNCALPENVNNVHILAYKGNLVALTSTTFYEYSEETDDWKIIWTGFCLQEDAKEIPKHVMAKEDGIVYQSIQDHKKKKVKFIQPELKSNNFLNFSRVPPGTSWNFDFKKMKHRFDVTEQPLEIVDNSSGHISTVLPHAKLLKVAWHLITDGKYERYTSTPRIIYNVNQLASFIFHQNLTAPDFKHSKIYAISSTGGREQFICFDIQNTIGKKQFDNYRFTWEFLPTLPEGIETVNEKTMSYLIMHEGLTSDMPDSPEKPT